MTSAARGGHDARELKYELQRAAGEAGISVLLDQVFPSPAHRSGKFRPSVTIYDAAGKPRGHVHCSGRQRDLDALRWLLRERGTDYCLLLGIEELPAVIGWAQRQL